MISNIDKTESERLNQKLRDIVTGKYQSPAKQRNNFFSTNLNHVQNEDSNLSIVPNGTKDSNGVKHYTLEKNAPAYLPGAEKLFTVRNNIVENQIKSINKQSERNEYYTQKYKDTPKTYEGYMNHAAYVGDDEKRWLEEQAAQYATVDDLKKKYNENNAEMVYLSKAQDNLLNKMKEVDEGGIEYGKYANKYGKLQIQRDEIALEQKTLPYKISKQARITAINERNKYYSEKYKDTPKTYEGYMKHAQYVSSDEREWLEKQAEQYATPEDYKKEADKASADYNYLNSIKADVQGNGGVASNKLEDLISEANTNYNKYKSSARKKEYEEKTKDILESDARVRSIVQQYYAYQKNSEQRKSDNGETVRIDLKSGNKYTPEQEQRIVENFNNLANEGYDPKALYTYYDRAMQEQASIENLQKIQQDAMNNPVGASAWSVLDNVVGSVGDAFKYIGAGIAEDVTGEYQWINTYDTAAARVNTVRSTVSDKIGADIGNETAGKVSSFLYQTGMSLADFAATLPLNLVPGVGTGLQMVLLSSEAGTAAAKESYDNTGSASKALSTGIWAGIAEAFFEKFSIEKTKYFASVTPDSVKSIFKNAGKQMFTELTEEGLTTIANTMTDCIINGDMSSIALEYQGYIDEGYTKDEATAKCAGSFVKQVLLDAAGGAVSGGVLGGSVSGISYAKGKINTNIDMKKSAEEIGKEVMSDENFDINLLLEQAKNSGSEKAVSIAKSIEKKMSGNKNYKVNSVDVGNLMKLIGAESLKNTISENTDVKNDGVTANEGNINTVSKEEITEHIKYNFGNSHKNGITATDNKGKSVVIVGFESSARYYGEADNKVRVIADDGRVYNADSLTFNLPEYQSLMNAAKNFDTNGAGLLLREYGDYVNFKGKESDINNYIDTFTQLYEAGKMGARYNRVAAMKYYGKYIDAIGPQRAMLAVEAGNKDSDLFFNNEEKLARIDRSSNVKANVYVEKSAEETVNLDEGTRLALEKLSEMTGKEIILTADMDENGRIDFRNGKIYIRASLDGNYILPVAMHESMHSFRRESSKDYRLIRNFVVDYLYASGHDVMKMADNVKINYGDRLTTNEDCIEEIVCNSIMAIAGDESAMHKALQVAKADEGVLQKLANAIKNLASKIKEFIITHTTNEAAQAFVNDVKALDKLAEMFSNAADNIKAKSEEVITNEQKNNTGKGVESGDVKYSIKENVKNKVSGEIYDKVVVLDTNIFKGIPPRNWGKTFRNFISKHLIGKKFLTFDENGKEEIIEFAKPNERVTKNGANNSHKVIDKLSRKSDRNSKLVIVHSDEVINISEKQNENAEHSHQWLDENGWEFRNAFVMDKYGKIYSVTLNIAKSKDGRNILYDINKINEVGYGDVLSNAKGKRSSHINPNFVTNSISQSENNVNTKNDESSNDIKYSMGGLKAETADKSALEKAMELEKDGTDSEKIRKETGWFKGYDGKWRFEIDNSELKFKTDIEKNRAAAIELAKMKVKSAELEEKIVNDTATKAEENEYYNLDEKMIEYREGVKLSDVINHPKLFEAYPQLKNLDVYYEISSVNRGVYSSNGNVIMLNPMHTIDEQKEAIIHEIQHAIQGIENFANGSNLEYWKNLGYSDEEAMAMYYNTAGEREARDVSARRDYNAEQRKNIRPDIDRKDVVFANSGDAGYLIDDTKSSAEKYSEDDFENKVVYPNMDERQRAQILRNERIKLSSYDSKNALSPDDVASLENSVKRNAFKILRELGTKFKVYKNYTNENIELDFDYSKSGLKESIDKQGNITTNYTDFAKMLTVFDDVIRNAVPIEVHTDKYVGTKRENPDLKYDYVLLSAFTDDNYIVPVELHIKEYKESYRINNKLYVSITLGKIKNEDNIITGSLLKNNNEVANSVPLSSEVSIPQLVSKVNEKLGNFYKYLPDELLSETQLKYKKIAAEKDRQRLSTMRNKTIQTENKSDIKYATDDTINDWLDDESTPQGIDYEKAVEKNPVIAVAKIYKSAAQTAKSGLAQGKNVKLDEKEYLRIAGSIMQTYGIKGKYNPNYKKELASQLKNFVDSIGKKDANFTDLFEELVNDCKGGILLSGEYDTTLMREEREFVLDMLQGKVLLIKPRDVQQIEEDYGSVANYRKKMFGKTYVAVKNKESGKGYYIEDVITHIEENYPYLLNENADGDMGYLWLEDLVNNVLKPKYKNPYFEGENSFYETPETAAIQMAFECASKIINAKTEKLKADTKADKKLIKEIETSQKEAINIATEIAEAKNKQYRQELKEAKERNIKLWKRNAKLSQEKKEEHRKRVEHSRELFSRLNKEKSKVRVEKNKNAYSNKIIEAQKAIIASHYKTIREEYNENREKTLYLNKLGKMCDRLTKRLDGKAKNNEYIPDNLKGPIIDVLSCFTVKDAKNATPGYFGEWNRIKEVGESVAELANEYNNMKPEPTPSTDLEKKEKEKPQNTFIDIESISYKEPVNKQLENLKALVKGHNIYTLTSNELVAIYDTMQMLDESLRDAVQIIVDGRKQNFKELANEAMQEVKNNKARVDYSKMKNVLAAPAKQLGKSFVATHLDPVRYGRMLSNYHDDSIIYKLFSGLHEGENKAITIQQKAISRIKEVTLKYEKEIKGIQNEDVKEFDFRDVETGRRVPITKGVLLAIYLTDRQKSGHIHLLGGTEETYANEAGHYTVLPNLELSNKKLKRTANENSHKVRFNVESLKRIEKYVQNDKVLMELATAISEVYNQTLKQEINEVSMAKYGMKIATVKDYYPLKVDPNAGKYEKNLKTEFHDTRLKSRGFTKQRQWSDTPIVIDDALRNFVKQVKSVSEYCGLLIPIENFKKVYNYSDGSATLQSTIKERYGVSAEHYIDKLIGDLQQRADTIDNTFLDKIQSNYMGMKIAFNFGSMIKQVSAFPLANRYFGAKNVSLAAMNLFRNKVDFDLYNKYTSYLWYRKEGNGTVIGELSKEMSLTSKGMGFLDIVSKMDNRVVSSLLYAAELHVEQTTDLKKGTDAFYREVARQFEKCIDETQPNNMVTSKPQYMRNKNLRRLSLNAFRSQNMAIGNTIFDSFFEMKARMADDKINSTAESKAAKKAAVLKFVSCCSGAISANLLLGALSLLSSICLYHRWDDLFDDEGNISGQKIALNYLDEVLNGIFGSFAMGDYLYSAVSSAIDIGKTYYGLQAMSVDSINDMVKDLISGKALDALKTLLDCLGIPGTNFARFGSSIYAYYNDVAKGSGRIITDSKGNVNTDYLHYYIVEDKKSGNDTRAEHYENMWKEILIEEKGKTESEATDYIKSKIVTALSADDDIEEAGVAKANGNLADYEKYRQKVIDYGFDSKDVQKAIDRFIKSEAKLVSEIEDNEDRKQELIDNGFNEKGAEFVINKINESKSDDETGSTSVFDDTSEENELVMYRYSDLFDALINGDTENYSMIENYLIEKGGKTKKEIKSAMRSTSRTDKLWGEYIEASTGNDRQRTRELVTQLTRIYGSWENAKTALKKYQNKIK
nr:MAG TPA: Large polyvalent protein associated domain 23 [Caudoviricetes sp.]